jgi:hypothetical protein
MERAFHNLPLRAVDGRETFQRRVESAQGDLGRAAREEDLAGALILMPNRTQSDAWSDAAPLVKKRAAEECRRAAGGDELRDYALEADSTPLKWTLRLVPVAASFYRDDSGRRHRVIADLQTGEIVGRKVASFKLASLITVIGLLGALGMVIGGAVIPVLSGGVVNLMSVVLPTALAIASTLPLLYVTQHNAYPGNLHR